jgi:hypothetical protein
MALTRADISRAFDEPVSPGDNGGGSCAWPVGDRLSFDYTYFGSAPGKGNERFQARRRDVTGPTFTVSGLGDDAFFQSNANLHGSNLTVRDGDFIFILTVGSRGSTSSPTLGLASAAKAKPRLIKLAKVVLRKHATSLIEHELPGTTPSPTTHT